MLEAYVKMWFVINKESDSLNITLLKVCWLENNL